MTLRILSLFLLSTVLWSCDDVLYTETSDEGQPYYIKVDDYTLDSPVHLVRDIPTLADDNHVNVVVEIPTGTLEKWEVNKDSGDLNWEIKNGVPRVVEYVGYPGNYGFIPRTLLPNDAGGDGDPLDVIVLGPPVARGTVLKVSIIGMIRMQDRGENDDKLIGVTSGTPFDKVQTLEELDQKFAGVTDILSTWFAHYKGEDKVDVMGVESREVALEVLARAKQAYAK
ncbi:MAG: inorganic diphosphatase [Flavobacteriales bacterium]|nr:inorganic diphosphatase [Flavobacteriales bacterium]